VRFWVHPKEGTKISGIKNLSEELAAALGAPNCRVSRRGAAVSIEVPRDDPQPVKLMSLYKQLASGGPNAIPPFTAILGLADDGAPLLIKLPSSEVGHILIAGAAGAGKTMLLQAITLSLAMTNRPEDLAFIFLGDGLAETATAIQQQGFPTHRITSLGVAVLRSAIRTIGKRIIFVADEVVGNGDPRTVAALKERMENSMHHYIMAYEEIPPREMAELFKVRLVGRVASAEDAHTATGCNGTGAERLLGQGDFLAVAEGQVTRFQSAYVSLAEIQKLPAQLALAVG